MAAWLHEWARMLSLRNILSYFGVSALGLNVDGFLKLNSPSFSCFEEVKFFEINKQQKNTIYMYGFMYSSDINYQWNQT